MSIEEKMKEFSNLIQAIAIEYNVKTYVMVSQLDGHDVFIGNGDSAHRLGLLEKAKIMTRLEIINQTKVDLKEPKNEVDQSVGK